MQQSLNSHCVVCSLDNKLDYIRLQLTTQQEFRDCCVLVFTETWLSDRGPDAAVQLHGLTTFCADRNAALCGKTHGGGLCVYISSKWCKNAVLACNYCSSLVEFMATSIRTRVFFKTEIFRFRYKKNPRPHFNTETKQQVLIYSC